MERTRDRAPQGRRVKKAGGKWVDDPVADESEHFYVCAACGQAVDMRDLGQVLHHEMPDHQPLPLDG